MSAGPADQLAVTPQLAREHASSPSIAERLAGRAAARRGRACRRARAPRRRAAIASGLSVQTIATSTGSLPWAVAPQRLGAREPLARRGSRTHTASTPRACAAAMCSSPLQPAPTTSRLSPGRTPARSCARSAQPSGSVSVADHRVEAVERQQLVDELGLRSARTRRSRPGRAPVRAEALAQRLVAVPAAAALAARRVVVDRHAVADRHAARRPRRPRPPRRPARGRAPPGSLRATYQPTSEPQVAQASTRQTTSPGPQTGSGRSSIRVSSEASGEGDPHATLATVSAVTGRRDAALGHQRPHELGGRDVERRVAARRARDGQQRAAGRAHLVGVALLDLDRVAGRAAAGRSTTTARRPRTGRRPRRRPARARRCRPCSPRRRWRPRGRSR